MDSSKVMARSQAVGRTNEKGTTPVRLALAFASLLAIAALGCASTTAPTATSEATPEATPMAESTSDEARVSNSRCAPGAVLDGRHALCNGMSGRWW